MRGKFLVPDFVIPICLGGILAMFCISNAAVQHVKKISVVQYSTILGKGFPTGSCEDKCGADRCWRGVGIQCLLWGTNSPYWEVHCELTVSIANGSC